MHNLFVIKRNGKKELFEYKKINRILFLSSRNLKYVCVSKIRSLFNIQFYNKIKTSYIHKILIKITADLISEDFPDYQYMAARLLIFYIRKKVFGQFYPPSLYTHICNLVRLGKYDKNLLVLYSKKEFDIINSFIKHDRDMCLSYVSVKQFKKKYLIQDRVSGQIYESIQFVYILISLCLFSKYNKNIRMKYIKDFYNAISLLKISLSTPILAGVRTNMKQFSSCILIECGDSLDSINATTNAITKYISQRAGIGINAGRLRALGSPVRLGDARHTGCIPFYKLFQSAVKCCSQGGIRNGAATIFFPIWHLEVEQLLILKNNRGIEDNRVRHMDYAVQINKLMYNRLINKGNITLFNPVDVPDLYNSFFSDQEKFEHLYIIYEKDVTLRKKVVKALDLFTLMMQERTSTGRIYIQNVDNCNLHSAFNVNLAPIKQSNLCLEITLPTKPLISPESNEGEIGLCTLSAFNLGEINDISELKYLSVLIVRALDELLDYQDYPFIVAQNSALNRRSLGIGVTNFAYFLAKNKVRYSDGTANNLTHKIFEYIQYYLLHASNILAKEKGMCVLFHETNYYKGLLPIDTYKKDVDFICNELLHLNWNLLRKNIKKYGLRNSTLSAIMPCETSSQVSNSTNGIEPPRGFITIKLSKDGILKQVVPDLINLRDKYELLWNIPNNKGYLELIAIMQKFIDQSISANTNYDPKSFYDNKISMTQLLKDLLTAYKLGLKTLYYQNTRDNAEDTQIDIIKNLNTKKSHLLYKNHSCNACVL